MGSSRLSMAALKAHLFWLLVALVDGLIVHEQLFELSIHSLLTLVA